MYAYTAMMNEHTNPLISSATRGFCALEIRTGRRVCLSTPNKVSTCKLKWISAVKSGSVAVILSNTISPTAVFSSTSVFVTGCKISSELVAWVIVKKETKADQFSPISSLQAHH